MSTSTQDVLLACEEAGLAALLVKALAERIVTVRSASYAEAGGALDAHPRAIIIAPALSARAPAPSWSEVAEELTRNFEFIQRFVRQCIAGKRGGHVVALLPALAAMGDPSDSGTSALCGGMLSLVRTLALELRKVEMTANAVFFQREGGNAGHARELAALLQTLVAQAGHAITGQAIYACGGADAGRLHP